MRRRFEPNHDSRAVRRRPSFAGVDRLRSILALRPRSATKRGARTKGVPACATTALAIASRGARYVRSAVFCAGLATRFARARAVL
jgi:hypothetical protein